MGDTLGGHGRLHHLAFWYGGELPSTYFRYGTPAIVDTDEASNIYYNPLENKLKEERVIRNRLEPKFKEAIEEKRPEAEHIK